MCCVQPLSVEQAFHRFEAPIDDPRNRNTWTPSSERETKSNGNRERQSVPPYQTLSTYVHRHLPLSWS